MAVLQDVVITLVIIAVVIVVPVVVSTAFNRGKRLKCPKCSNVFESPFFDEKMIGYGWSLPYMGNVECPHCHGIRSRRAYDKVKKSEVVSTELLV